MHRDDHPSPDHGPRRGADAAFSQAELAGRVARLRHALLAHGAEALVVTGPENIFWATGRQTAGYFAFQALILPAEGAPILLVRDLERTGAVVSTWLDDIRVWQDGEDPAQALAAILRALGVGRVAIETQGWFVAPKLLDRIRGALPDLEWSDGSGLAEGLRLVKSPAELDALRRAAAYAQAGMQAALTACRAGVSENEIAAEMTAAAIRAGSEGMAMEPLVSSGPRAGVPHATWRRRILQPGDPVFLELAASHDRYHAALMRSLWIGPPPAEAQRMMDVALRALDAALAAMRPGRPCCDPHDAAQAVIDDAGYAEAFRKRIGYSMGIAFAPDWGEGALLSLFAGVDRVLEPGMVFHLPATLRRFGAFTVGASETVILTPSGPEVLSELPRAMSLR